MIDVDHPVIQICSEAMEGHHPERGGAERQQAIFTVLQAAINSGFLKEGNGREPSLDRSWAEKKVGEPFAISEIPPTEFILPSRQQRLREALLSVGDFAYRLMPGQMMIVERHAENKDDEGRMFTVMIHNRKED
jgi:hypothetical protein